MKENGGDERGKDKRKGQEESRRKYM
jgi:hypothetical protein